MCFLARRSMSDSGEVLSYSSSGAEQRARSGSVVFMEQYQREGSLRASTTPRSRRHFLQRSHSTQVALLAPVVSPKIELSSFPLYSPSWSSADVAPDDRSVQLSSPAAASSSRSSSPGPDMSVSPLLSTPPPCVFGTGEASPCCCCCNVEGLALFFLRCFSLLRSSADFSSEKPSS